ncbi:hypothetical protein [Microbispora amethystogenes]|uniref:Uncharacterized protein n=1 Tax=Microbispora amethystogenes TaxID=1427754 RepID=A0ABQ4FA54_9ACTN|nr:hypothetical protein [Microbispora amethystogenes]GIH31697.1 hypothetical protein Mam01_18610 [Microbispora amethystogenes]
MNLTVNPNPGTAALALYDGARGAVVAAASVVSDPQVMRTICRDAPDIAGQLVAQLPEAGARLLHGITLGRVLAAGWQKSRELRAAAVRSHEDGSRGKSAQVRLAAHSITSEHRPYVEVYSGERKVLTITFSVDLTFTIGLLYAGIRDGRLVTLHPGGDCEVAVSWGMEGFKIGERTMPIRIPAVAVPLGAGIPLARPPF